MTLPFKDPFFFISDGTTGITASRHSEKCLSLSQFAAHLSVFFSRCSVSCSSMILYLYCRILLRDT